MVDCTLEFLKIDPRAVIPKYAHTGDMCMDISVLIDENEMKPMYMDDSVHSANDVKVPLVTGKIGDLCYAVIEPGQSLVFHTGLKCATPKGYGLKVHVRSSVGIKKKLQLTNCTGIIDTSQYRGELMIALLNNSSKARKIFSGDRVAQGEIVKVLDVEIVEVTTLSDTERGEGGIGSTGV